MLKASQKYFQKGIAMPCVTQTAEKSVIKQ